MKTSNTSIKSWLLSNFENTNLKITNIKLATLFLLLGFSLPISAISYLSSYFKHYEIDYFMHFSATDSIHVLHSFFELIYLLLILSLVIFLVLLTPFISNKIMDWVTKSYRPSNLAVLIIIVILSIIISYAVQYFLIHEFQFSFPVLLLLLFILLTSIYKSVQFLYLFLIFIPAFFQQKGSFMAHNNQQHPQEFTVTLKVDDSKEQIKFDGCSYLFIHKTDKSLFYEDVQEKIIHIVPVEAIIETTFSSKSR